MKFLMMNKGKFFIILRGNKSELRENRGNRRKKSEDKMEKFERFEGKQRKLMKIIKEGRNEKFCEKRGKV